MRSYPAQDVLSPRDLIDSVQVIDEREIDDGAFSVARIMWKGETEPKIGIRWNVAEREWEDQDKIDEVKQCVGMPSSRGLPVWFILANELLDRNL